MNPCPLYMLEFKHAVLRVGLSLLVPDLEPVGNFGIPALDTLQVFRQVKHSVDLSLQSTVQIDVIGRRLLEESRR